MLSWGSASFVVSCVLPFHHLIRRASSKFSYLAGLRIEGRPAEESESGRTGNGFGSPTDMVAGVLLVGYLPSQARARKRLARLGIHVAPNI